MTDYTKELLFGMRPVRRTDPRPGESEWYYLDPRGADTFDSMKHIDVESETSPNPYAGEIQDYLYKNDPYNYKQLYGNTPPPVQNNQSMMHTTPVPITQTPQATDDYQRGLHKFEQANAAGSFMSGIGNSFDGSHTPSWNDDYSNTLNNQQNYTTPNDINKISSASLPQADVLGQQRRAVENDLLMNGMDTLYGMNRTINGMTFGGLDRLGNKLGFDSQMNDYLQLKDAQSRNLAQTAGQIASYGGSALTGGALANAGYNQANMAYNGYKIGKAYDKLTADPFQGNGSDVIARMKNHNGEPVILQRGEAIRGPNGEVVTSGRVLQRETGTERNYGLDKIIYKHEMPRNEVTRIPQYLKQYQPEEISPRGQGVYAIRQPNGEIRLITTPRGNYSTVSSMYIKNK